MSFRCGFNLPELQWLVQLLREFQVWKPVSETIAARYLKLLTVSKVCLITLLSSWMPFASFVISLVFYCSCLHFIPCTGFVDTIN